MVEEHNSPSEPLQGQPQLTQGQQVYYVQAPSHSLAVSAFVLSLLTLFFPILGVAGLVMGWKALHSIALGRKTTGRGLATAAVIIPLALYGLWWFILGILLWATLWAIEDLLSLLQLETLYENIWLFREIQDRATMLVVSGIVAGLCAVIIPIQLNRAIDRKQPTTRQQTLALIGFPLGFVWLLFTSLLGNLAFFLSLLLISLILVYFKVNPHDKKIAISDKIDFTNVKTKRQFYASPRDVTGSQLILVGTAWLVQFIVVLILWLLSWEPIAWYLGLVAGLAVGTFALLVVPVVLGINVSELQPIDLKAVAITVFGPTLALVVAALLWWVAFIIVLIALVAFLFHRLGDNLLVSNRSGQNRR